MNYAFFGTPTVAKDTLAKLIESGYTPAVVITNPDAPRGRGHALTPSETNVLAREHGIPVLTPAALDDDAAQTIASYGCEYAIVVAYGKILPETYFTLFPKGIFNVHYSLLPKYRGASPVETALLHGETETGVTIQRMALELDAGDILAQEREAIDPKDTTVTLRARLIRRGAELLIKHLPEIEAGTATYTPQDHTAATYARKIKKEDGLIRLDAPAHENWNKYRAYAGGTGTYFFTERDGKTIRVKITQATLADDGTFAILRIIPEGKQEMDFESYFRK